MRLISAASIVFVLAVVFVVSGFTPATHAEQRAQAPAEHGPRQRNGQHIFRFDTFGDEQLWTDVLRMHEVLPTVDPATALAVGLKVDVDALPASRHRGPAGRRGRSHRPGCDGRAVAPECRRRRQGDGRRRQDSSRRSASPARCATRLSTTPSRRALEDGSMAGRTQTSNVGAIVALSPALDDATKAEFRRWGPGKYDPRHHAFDGASIIPLNTPSLPIVIPPIYGLQGRRVRDVHRRRPDFVLEQLRRRRPDGWPRQRSSIRESDCSSSRRRISSRRSCRRCSTIS